MSYASPSLRYVDWERMTTFYAFPKEHWKHVRTTNVRGVGVRDGAAADDSRQALQDGGQRYSADLEDASGGGETFPHLNAPELLPAGAAYVNGVRVNEGTKRVPA